MQGDNKVAVVVNLSKGQTKKPSLATLKELTAVDIGAVDKLILQQMHSPVEIIPQLAGHIIAAGGKRLRPMLTLAAARMCGYEGERHIHLASCIEFIHTATLLHDDVVDDSGLRRGMKSANTIWGNSASVLVGDFLFSRSFELMVQDGSKDVLRLLSKTSSVIAEGEVMQLMTANDTETGETTYLEVITCKTAQLFAAATQIGAVIANRPKVEEEALKAFGLNLGISFQLIDDVLDYSAVQADLGKSIGDDFREGKITLPVILAFRRGNDQERIFWRRALEDLNQSANDLDQAITLLARHNAMEDTVERARHYGAIARDALGIFSDGPEKSAFLELIEFCIDRPY